MNGKRSGIDRERYEREQHRLAHHDRHASPANDRLGTPRQKNESKRREPCPLDARRHPRHCRRRHEERPSCAPAPGSRSEVQPHCGQAEQGQHAVHQNQPRLHEQCVVHEQQGSTQRCHSASRTEFAQDEVDDGNDERPGNRGKDAQHRRGLVRGERSARHAEQARCAREEQFAEGRVHVHVVTAAEVSGRKSLEMHLVPDHDARGKQPPAACQERERREDEEFGAHDRPAKRTSTRARATCRWIVIRLAVQSRDSAA